MKKILFLITFIGLILLSNPHLMGYSLPNNNIFFISDLANGRFYTLFTYAWIHVSWYHLLIDCAAFLMLLYSLQVRSFPKKIFYVTVCMISSALTTLLNPQISSLGLCGLSGTAHGLSIICAMEYLQQKETHTVGVVLIIITIAKTVYEIYTGRMLFMQWHLGYIGNPIIWSHVGGTFGGWLSYCLLKLKVFSPRTKVF